MSAPIRVVLVDDEAMVRVGLRMVLSGEPDLEVVGEAGDGAEAVDVVLATRPDVVLMDVRMPRVDGIEGSRRGVAAAPGGEEGGVTPLYADHHLEGGPRGGGGGVPPQRGPPPRALL